MSRLRPLLARVPSAAWLCGLAAVVSGLAWAMLVPPYHVPDEPAHLAYTQYLAETGDLPVRTPGQTQFSDEQQALLEAVRFEEVVGLDDNRPPITPAETQKLREIEADPPSRVASDAGSATENGPLYYALASVPYLLSPSTDLLDRMMLIRLLSVLFAGLTAITVVLFLREILPSEPWIWTVGGLLAAFEPMAGFMSAGVNPDSMLFFLSALTILAATRCLRRGVTRANAALLAGVVVAGLLTKPLYQGLLPGVGVALLGCLVLARGRMREPLRGLATGGAVAAAAAALYLLLTNTVLERVAAAQASEVVSAGSHPLSERLSYMWQLFLPRLPFQTDLIEGFPLQDLWAPRFLGQFGWLDYGYQQWVGDVFFWLCVVLLVGLVVTLVRLRGLTRPRVVELVTYAAFVAGVLFAIAWTDYRSRVTDTALFEQGRYLLPLLVIFLGAVGVVLKGLGPRWGRVVGAVLVVAMVAASVFGQMMTIERYYS